MQNVKRDPDVLNRLNKTKKELYPDLQAERQAFDRRASSARKSELQERRTADKAAKAEAARQADLRSYKHLMQAGAQLLAGRCGSAGGGLPDLGPSAGGEHGLTGKGRGEELPGVRGGLHVSERVRLCAGDGLPGQLMRSAGASDWQELAWSCNHYLPACCSALSQQCPNCSASPYHARSRAPAPASAGPLGQLQLAGHG